MFYWSKASRKCVCYLFLSIFPHWIHLHTFSLLPRETQPCSECSAMLSVAKSVATNSCCQLASAYRSAFPLHTYKPDIARLRLLQMPLACICLGNLKQGTCCWYLVEYVQGVDCEVCMLCECFANYQSISISAHWQSTCENSVGPGMFR